ncbi:rhodanese-like domain-containing protein [Pannonibacter sp. Q-1]|uniref:Rhodanese n=1 Tax=Pannonibacter phragmitetus TaxID=121719 RepID=A0A0L0IX26_9HYPH|nr:MULTISPECIES: rhodanese-like domain-containing protein [Pannonibacter]ALV28163.1 rhodanese [Pannonibacter phragmitetus]KND17650.1 rhodanese [Pannonibacter phragmitetus]MBA4203967.1 adenylyltransferase/sulfurtransferase MoeZ [Polymorphum sp.]
MAHRISRGIDVLLAEAAELVSVISAEEAKLLLGRDGYVFVDLRDVREIQREGAIPGAFSCPRGMLEFWIDPASPYHKPVFASDATFVFFCAAGWRSALAARTAIEMGLETVVHLEGGFAAWATAGGAVEQMARRA